MSITLLYIVDVVADVDGLSCKGRDERVSPLERVWGCFPFRVQACVCVVYIIYITKAYLYHLR